jgi:hypothetical protein
MRRSAVRLLVVLTALATLAAGCSHGTNKAKTNKIGEQYKNMSASSVKPPLGPDTQSLALPGFIVATNSKSWVKLVGSPGGQGAVVLFIQPGGPTDNVGIARGDLLVQVDDQPIANAERAVAVLHSRVGQKRTLTFRRANKKKNRVVTITGRAPRGNPIAVLSPEIDNNPTDPTLRYLRAYSGGTDQARLGDLKIALQSQPDFVDALQLRASLLWASSFNQRDAKTKQTMQIDALAGWKNALDIDPRNATTYAVRSIAETDLGTAKNGEADALRALNIDGSQPLALFALSRARLAENKTADALGPADGAVVLQPYNLDYWKNLASIFKKVGRKSDCVKTTDAFVPYLRARKGQAFLQAATDLQKVCS